MHDLEHGIRWLETNDLKEQLIRAKEELQDLENSMKRSKNNNESWQKTWIDFGTQVPEIPIVKNIKILSATRPKFTPEIGIV